MGYYWFSADVEVLCRVSLLSEGAQGSHGHGKSWKTMENKIQAWKSHGK